MAQGRFSAQVSAWVAETKERMVAVRNESAQRVIEIMQTPVAMGGRMRVDTGFLRASLMATIGQANFVLRDKPPDDARYSYDAGPVALVIAAADLNDTITAVYTAKYARAREYKGDRFVGMAALQWQRIVQDVAAEALRRSGG